MNIILSNYKVVNKLFVSIVLLFLTINLSAGELSNLSPLVNTNLIINNSVPLTIVDLDNGVFSNEKYEYLVKLIYGRELGSDIELNNVSENWSFKIVYDITFGSNQTLNNQVLEINWKYDNPSKLIDLNAYNSYLNESEASITIVNVLPTSNSTLPNDIQFELVQKKSFSENLFNIGLQNSQIGTSLVNNGEKLEVYWQYVEGAEEYELEWVFIDDEDQNNTLGLIDETNVFNHAELNGVYTANRHYKEPVNIITSNNFFEIPLTYTAGMLYYRIRPIGVYSSNSDVVSYGMWNSPSLEYSLSLGFENDKNWQSVVSYAENGKSKNIVSYLDGSYRQRQTLTDLSTDDLTLVTESMYDYEGVASLNVLPTPLNSSSLSYISHLNILTGTTNLFTKKDFDKLTQTPGLDNASGASRYYSENNNIDQVNKDYIPDAKNYPFTQTKFLRDGTGRIEAQSGIGEDMQLLSGKETKFYYGGTNETELKRLFGSNVGFTKFCRKNMVKDPNGQLSVSYLDYQSRTIATALIGKSPDNVIPLVNDPILIRTNLAGQNNVLDLESRTWTSVSNILNSVEETDYEFSYDFVGAINQLGYPVSICSTCEYDLEILVKNPDGELMPIFSSAVCSDVGLGIPTPSFHANFDNSEYKITASYPEIPFDCQTEPYPNYSIDFEMKFCEIGNYEIVKILHINDSSIKIAFEELIGSIDTHQLHIDIIQDELNQINYSQCDYLCAQTYWFPCKALYISNSGINETQWDALTESEKNEALEACIEDSCSAELSWVIEEVQQGECASYLRQMKDQLFRDGLVNGNPNNDGVYNDGINSIEENAIWTDVTNILQALTGTDQDSFITKALICYTNLDFYDGNGNIQNYSSNVQTIIANMRTDAQYCEFIEDWVVRAHPEYCHYEICISNIESNTYDSKLQLTSTYDEALSINDNYNDYKFAVPIYYTQNISNILNSITMPAAYPNYFSNTAPVNFPSSSSYLGGDPYFSATGLGYPYLSLIQTEMQDFSGQIFDVDSNSSGYDMWHYFHPQFNHPNNGTPISGADKFYSLVDLTDRDEVLERHWQLFNSSYLELKRQVKIKYNEDNCSYLDKEYAVVKQPSLPSNQEEADDFINDHAIGYITDLCESKIAAWRAQLIDLCQGLTVTYYNDNIAPHLLDYCFSNAGFSNPDGLIFTSDLASSISGGPLYEAQLALSSCPACTGCFIDSIVTDNPYTLLLNSDGSNYEDTIPNVTPCLNYFLEFIETKLFPVGVYSYTVFGGDFGDSFLPLCFDCLNEEGDSIADYFKLGATNSGINFHHSGSGYPCFTTIKLIDNASNSVVDPFTIQSYLSHSFDQSSIVNGLLTDSHINLSLLDNNGNIREVRIFYEKCGEYNCELPVVSFTVTNAIGGIDSTYLAGGPIFEIDFDSLTLNCQEQLEYEANENADRIFEDSLTNLVNQYLKEVLDNCKIIDEEFFVKYILNEYHYTLYYYDQAGNLTQTVPPEGVHPVSSTQFPLSNYGKWDGTEPIHTLKTKYTYNTLNQVIQQETPDGGTSYFFYDKKGQLKLSANAQQLVDNKASFTLYDEMGRIKEVGQLDRNIIPNSNSLADIEQWRSGVTKLVFKDYNSNQEFIENFTTSASNVQERTFTEYGGQSLVPYQQPWQNNLRGRVATVYNTNANDDLVSKTLYSYDEHGNVKELYQYVEGFDVKTLRYEYDLLSGNVNKVVYQMNQLDQFIHRYEYDADNRLTNVYTSNDGYLWDEDAEYFYYAHGPLARVEIGEDKVQGLDYYYTLHGWLKGINNPNNESLDPGKDGISSNSGLNNFNVKDEFALNLGYYEGDYQNIGSNNIGENWSNINTQLFGAQGLYNGNIAYMAQNIAPNLIDDATGLHNFGDASLTLPWGVGSYRLGAYQYDQLNRIKQSKNVFKNVNDSFVNGFMTSYTYDGNGNITDLNRRDNQGFTFDNFSYKYNLDGQGELENNKLSWVDDEAASLPINTDGDYNDIIVGQFLDNYSYDSIGNLTSDVSEKIEEIKWTVYGKVSEVIRELGSDKSDLEYLYDAMGNRIIKIVKPRDISSGVVTPNQWTYTYYTRDASGNIMATYTEENNVLNEEVEYNIFGSSRLGINKTSIVGLNFPGSYNRTVGNKFYEFSNHLGNVNVVVSDRRLGQDVNSSNTYYTINDGFHWCMDNNGSLLERNGSGHDLINAGGALVDYDADNVLSAYKTDAGDYLMVPDHADLDFGADDFTVSVWVNTHTSNNGWNGNTLVNKWNTGSSQGSNEWTLTASSSYGGSGNSKFIIESGTTKYIAAATTHFVIGQWYHLVGKREGDFIKIYVNGVEEGNEYIGSNSVNNVGRDLLIGKASSYYGRSIVDDLCIFNRALSSAEIAALYQRTNKCEGTTITTSLDGELDYYLADVVSATDYYPFGMTMPGRSYTSESYRFGFQGQEKNDDLTDVDGGHLDFKYRIHDARLGRFFSPDPLEAKYAYNSPYAFAENRVIDGIDYEGGSWMSVQHLIMWYFIIKSKLQNGERAFYNQGGNQSSTNEGNVDYISAEMMKTQQTAMNYKDISEATLTLTALSFGTADAGIILSFGGTAVSVTSLGGFAGATGSAIESDIAIKVVQGLYYQFMTQALASGVNDLMDDDADADVMNILSESLKSVDFSDGVVSVVFEQKTKKGKLLLNLFTALVDATPEGISIKSNAEDFAIDFVWNMGNEIFDANVDMKFSEVAHSFTDALRILVESGSSGSSGSSGAMNNSSFTVTPATMEMDNTVVNYGTVLELE